MRFLFLTCGLFTLAFAWLGPLPHLARQAFFAHMTMHMLVVAVAAPLLAVGLARGRFDPVRRVPWLFTPIPASVVELVVVWTWHAPALHHMARSHAAGLAVEQATFLVIGASVWLSAFGGDPQRARARSAAGIVALLLTSMHMTLLGALLALTPRPLYEHAAVFGHLSALDDQQLGGAIMLFVGGASYLFGGLCLTVNLLRHRTLQPEGSL